MTVGMRCSRGLLCFTLLFCAFYVTAKDFNVGVRGTKCNTDPSKGEVNNPCQSLYDGICGGKHCICPPGMVEDKALKRCKKGTGGGGSISSAGGAFDDLPFDFDPNAGAGGGASKPAEKPKLDRGQNGGRNQPQYPQQPGYNPNPRQPGYNPNQPGYNPNQPGYNPNQPGYNPNQPGYNPNQPGYNPNQPGYNPNQPGYNPNQPGYNPNSRQPGYNPNKPRGGGGDPHLGEKAGGGTGGVLGLLLLGALIYFCCFRGKNKSRGNNMLANIPVIGQRFRGPQNAAGDGGAASYPMNDPNFVPNDPNMQQPYPPPAQPGYPAGGQPGGPPPPGFYPGQPQQPPPYSQQYQPNAPPV